MAKFYGILTNSRGGAVTASGGSTGQTATVQGVYSGCMVRSRPGEDGEDRFDVYATHGKRGEGANVLIGTLSGGLFIPAGEQP